MKMFMGMSFLFLSLTSVAATVKVTSFNYVRSQGNPFYPLAELCGQVEGATSAPTFLKVLIDPKSNNIGHYNTLAGQDGKFCLAVITYRGSAEVSVMGEAASIEALIK